MFHYAVYLPLHVRSSGEQRIRIQITLNKFPRLQFVPGPGQRRSTIDANCGDIRFCCVEFLQQPASFREKQYRQFWIFFTQRLRNVRYRFERTVTEHILREIARPTFKQLNCISSRFNLLYEIIDGRERKDIQQAGETFCIPVIKQFCFGASISGGIPTRHIGCNRPRCSGKSYQTCFFRKTGTGHCKSIQCRS